MLSGLSTHRYPQRPPHTFSQRHYITHEHLYADILPKSSPPIYAVLVETKTVNVAPLPVPIFTLAEQKNTNFAG